MPTETPGGFRTIAAGFAEYSFEERFLKRGKLALLAGAFGRIVRIRTRSDLFRQVFREDVRRGAHRNRPFDSVFEFPDVSRPAICSQQLMGAGTNSRYFRVRGAPDVPVLPDKMRGKLRNVFAAFRECGHLQWKDVQAVKQIFPESSFFDLLAQIAVGGGNDPHIHLDHSASTEPLDLSSLNHAQKIRLHVERKLTDFVQEDRTAVLLFEQSFSLRDGAGESAPFIAEQLTLQQAFAERAAIHRNESFMQSGTIPVNRICH